MILSGSIKIQNIYMDCCIRNVYWFGKNIVKVVIPINNDSSTNINILPEHKFFICIPTDFNYFALCYLHFGIPKTVFFLVNK